MYASLARRTKNTKIKPQNKRSYLFLRTKCSVVVAVALLDVVGAQPWNKGGAHSMLPIALFLGTAYSTSSLWIWRARIHGVSL